MPDWSGKEANGPGIELCGYHIWTFYVQKSGLLFPSCNLDSSSNLGHWSFRMLHVIVCWVRLASNGIDRELVLRTFVSDLLQYIWKQLTWVCTYNMQWTFRIV